MVLLHGVIDVRIIRAHELGVSMRVIPSDKEGYQFGDGIRYAGKYLLNALRVTNRVRAFFVIFVGFRNQVAIVPVSCTIPSIERR